MLERLIYLKAPLEIALKDLGRSDMFNSVDWVEILNIITVLKPLEIGINKLSERNMDMLTTEKILRFIENELISEKKELAKSMFSSLKFRIS